MAMLSDLVLVHEKCGAPHLTLMRLVGALWSNASCTRAECNPLAILANGRAKESPWSGYNLVTMGLVVEWLSTIFSPYGG